ncbi:MAG: hypothetical protein VB031_06685 [Eubacteriaceae bacterium]|nr:hypothetical protein [Eubacteriaceae bacterium]
MDYIKELEVSLEHFKNNADHIKELPKLLESITNLTVEVDREKTALEKGISEISECTQKIDLFKTDIEQRVDTISKNTNDNIDSLKTSMLEEADRIGKSIENVKKKISILQIGVFATLGAAVAACILLIVQMV